MKILKHLCIFCYNEGDETPATHRYYSPVVEEFYDVCGEHLKAVKRDGYYSEPIETIEEIKEDKTR